MSDLVISVIGEQDAEPAIDLLVRFFEEEGFVGDRPKIAANFTAMLADPNCWAALAARNGQPVGIVTLSATRDVEFGRHVEVGDLYVLPEARKMGIAHALVCAGQDWCRSIGSQAILVVMTQEGNETYGLSRFYEKLGFSHTGRTVAECRLT